MALYRKMALFSPPPSIKSMSTRCSIPDLLDRQWMLPDPAAPIHKISIAQPHLSYSNDPRPVLGRHGREDGPSFYVVRDDLIHPLVSGNKARKLDALIPILMQYSATDVITCGGCQSAHTAALAVSCAERGIRSHLLLRGEQPEIPTGYNLIALMYGNVSYIARSVYARREEMLNKYADLVVGSEGHVVQVDDILASTSNGSILHLNGNVLQSFPAEESPKRAVIVSEGAGDIVALLGIIRLVRYLSQAYVFGKEQQIRLVLDAGTGTTAIGLALGVLCLGLPWEVSAVTLADTIEGYKKQERCLISNFERIHHLDVLGQSLSRVDDGMVDWVERIQPRKFGKVLKGEIELCRQIAQQTGILLDPIYTLSAWERSVLSVEESNKDYKVVMLHTGGTLGLFGLAQRYSQDFYTGGQAVD